MNNSEFSREIDDQLIEFELWSEENGTRDLDRFVQERRLEPKVAESLRLTTDLEQRLNGMVASTQQTDSVQSGEATESLGKVVGCYRLVKRLGAGGMGTVWLAEQQEPVQRQVAIKLIRRELGSELFARRFEAERQALAMMSHPHVAKVLDAGTHDNEEPYFVMEYVPGISITEYCNQNRCSLDQRLELFLQLCDATQHAHQKSLLHRDIKPGNVLVSEIDGKPQVKVIDFGLAKITADETRTDAQLTHPNTALGSPLWMSPEQAGATQPGKQDGVDTRSDIYSLGVVLYELLTDSTPITTEFYEHASLAELLDAIREKVPPCPSIRLKRTVDSPAWVTHQTDSSVSTWLSRLRNDLDWIVMKALEKEQDRRYPTAAAMADDIRRFINSEPVNARPPSFVYRLRKLVKRNRIAVVASVLVVLSLLATSIVSSSLTIWALNERKTADRERAKSEQFSRFSESGFEQLNLSNPNVEHDKFKESFLLSRLDELEAMDFSSDSLVEAEMRLPFARALSGLGKPELAVNQYQQVVDIFQRKLAPADPACIEAKIGLASEYLDLSNSEHAYTLAMECLSMATWWHGPNHELSLASEVLVYRVLLHQGKMDHIFDALQALVGRVDQHLEEKHPCSIRATAALASACYKTMRYRESALLYDKSRRAAAEHWGLDHRSTMELEILYWGARVLDVEPLEIRQELAGFIEHVRKKFGEGHVFSLKLRYLYGHMLFQQKDTVFAESIFDELIDDCKKHLGPGHLLTAQCRLGLADGLYWRIDHKSHPETRERDIARSLSMSRTALPVLEKKAGKNSLEFFKANYRIAEVLVLTGRPDEAVKIANKFAPDTVGLFGYSSKITNRFADLRIRCYADLQDIRKAMGVAREMLEIGRQVHGGDTSQTAIWLMRLGHGHYLGGNREKSIEYFKQALDVYLEFQGPYARDTHGVLISLHTIHAEVRNYTAAETYARQCLDHLTPEKRWTPVAQHPAQAALAEALAAQGKFAEAKALANVALETNIGPESNPVEKARAQGVLAACLIHEGQFETAEELLKAAETILIPDNLKRNPMTIWYGARCQERLVELYKASGEPGLVAEHQGIVDRYLEPGSRASPK